MPQSRFLALTLICSFAASGCHMLRPQAAKSAKVWDADTIVSVPENSGAAPDSLADLPNSPNPYEPLATPPESAPEFTYDPALPPAVPSPMEFPPAVTPQFPSTEPEATVVVPVMPPQERAIRRFEQLGADIKRNSADEVVSLDFSKTAVTDSDLLELSHFTELKILSLRNTGISNEGLQSLSLLTRLQLLIISGTAVTDDGLQHMWTLPSIRFIALDDTAVTDEVFRQLGGSKTLEGMSVMRTQVTREAAEKFRVEHPNCRVVTEPEAKPEESRETTRHLPRVRPQGTVEHAVVMKSPSTATSASRELQSMLKDRLHDPALLLAMGEQLILQKRYGDASGVLFTALLYAPEDREIQYQLGLALAYGDQMELAFPHLERAVGTAVAYHNLGVICASNEDLFRAEAYFARAVDADPALVESHRWLTLLRTRNDSGANPIPVRQLTEAQLLALLGSSLVSPSTLSNASGVTIIPAGGHAQ